MNISQMRKDIQNLIALVREYEKREIEYYDLELGWDEQKVREIVLDPIKSEIFGKGEKK